MRELAFSIRLIISPLPHINCLIRPSLRPKSIPLVILYLSMIDNPRRKLDDIDIILAFHNTLWRKFVQIFRKQCREVLFRNRPRSL